MAEQGAGVSMAIYPYQKTSFTTQTGEIKKYASVYVLFLAAPYDTEFTSTRMTAADGRTEAKSQDGKQRYSEPDQQIKLQGRRAPKRENERVGACGC